MSAAGRARVLLGRHEVTGDGNRPLRQRVIDPLPTFKFAEG
jgi:hypothetical protein